MAEEKKQTDLKKVKELIDLMKANDLVELEIVDGKNKILLKRPQPVSQMVSHIPIAPAASVGAVAAVPSPEKSSSQEEQEELVEIKSPIVGTFYASPSPDSPAFVSVDSPVGPDTVVCIIEAMKVMNEIKAETSGTIVKVLCKGGEAIEYGQPIFMVRPD